jgi:serine/threonine-protein kinase
MADADAKEMAEEEESPLSQRLTAPRSDPPPSLSPREREELAKKRVGTTIKGWRLARLLGIGAITAAYESFRGPTDGGEHVVLKLMLGRVATHERARSMFLRAAYASNRFNHPRVLAVLTDGTDADGNAFVVRPWVDAEPLETKVQRGEEMSEPAVLRMAEQILDALEMAHAHGIVHGAITPNNILVTPRGSMRLCDFATPPGMGPRTADEEDILAGRRVGPFTPPERANRPTTPPSEQTDIWAVAACMYYALSKGLPRGSATSAADLSTSASRPIREVAKVSEFVANIIDHALELEPASRYESAYAMLGDVRRAMAGRKPKLGDAHNPVPSGSYSGVPLLNSPSSARPSSLLRSDLPVPSSMRAVKGQWKGNLLLVLAIALLVGVATFVMVREKTEEARIRERRATSAPSASASTSTATTATAGSP